ncbi:unnamed protein product [Dibothriocephalus latus]|uniref:Uncharacterized protein n=1 Tax=Dibothriocephalus latus TaxID=60516 RepID=A0A3P7LKZ6_DIBLA|nr:unnamed protein product [Dibothriocephalus latus]
MDAAVDAKVQKPKAAVPLQEQQAISVEQTGDVSSAAAKKTITPEQDAEAVEPAQE